MVLGDTIAAIATALGRGGVAIVRVSGPEAFAVARRIAGKEPTAGKTVRARFAGVDDGVMVVFAAPHSYTGEDVVEFQGHGGAIAPRRVLEACLAAGARLARRGEFTERAFLNGRLDYDQAESVLDLVDAKTVRAADAALEGLAGRRHRECGELYETALGISTELEHALDVSEEELPDGFIEGMQARIGRLRERLATAVARANEGKILRQGALVVLAGPPNAGKSSLMNALLEENRAIVSDIPGTTRDSIEEWLDLDGWPIRLVDTAGLRTTADEIESEGVKRAEALVAEADVVLGLDCDFGLRVHSKCDLGRGEGLNVSAKTGEGLEELKRAVIAEIEKRVAEPGEGDSAPQGEGLIEALATLDAEAGRPFDMVLVANALRKTSELLGAMVGAVYSEDMLSKLFSRFCVGK